VLLFFPYGVCMIFKSCADRSISPMYFLGHSLHFNWYMPLQGVFIVHTFPLYQSPHCVLLLKDAFMLVYFKAFGQGIESR
jgi:hypothetical protein